MQLSWPDVAGETGYKVYRWDTVDTNAPATLIYPTLGANTTAFTATNLSPGALYIFKVASFNATGDSLSSAVSAVANNYCPPGPPLNPKVTAPTACLADGATGAATISWEKPTTGGPVERYDVFDAKSSTPLDRIGRTSNNIFSYSHSGLSAKSIHEYTVRAFGPSEQLFSDKVQTNPPTITIPGNCPSVSLQVREKGVGSFKSGYVIIDYGKEAELQWTTKNAQSCKAVPGTDWSGTKAAGGGTDCE